MNKQITLTVNGESRQLDVDVKDLLLQVLRESFGLTGTKEGCGTGECGACTVLVEDEPVNACLYLAVRADAKPPSAIGQPSTMLRISQIVVPPELGGGAEMIS